MAAPLIVAGCRQEEISPQETAATQTGIPEETAAAGASRLPEPNRLMAQYLQQYSQDMVPQENLYLNERRVADVRARMDPQPSQMQRYVLARELVQAGQTAEAIEYLQQLRTELPTGPEFHQTPLNEQIVALLAAAWLRLGEQENCISNHNIDSCLLPIGGEGVHQLTEGSTHAIEVYTGLLETYPERLDYRWLLNLAYMTLGQYPESVPSQWLIDPEEFASDYDIGRFYDVALQAGVAQRDLSGGSVMEDFDGDGLLDLVATSWDLGDQMRFFKNQGDGTFSDQTVAALLGGQTGGLNMTLADYDNDGDADLLVLRGGWLGPWGQQPNSLLENQGDGTFVDVTYQSGILSLHPTQTAAWGDYDNDGWLDVFIGNESRDKVHECELWHNNGNGTFTNVAAQQGLNHIGFVKAAVWGDYNNDGLLDLYLSQFGQPNALYENRGDSFVNIAEQAGVAEPLYSFPCWFFDYDNDGWLDLFVGSFAGFEGYSLPDVVAGILDAPTEASRCRLYRNQGDGTFVDVAPEMGVDLVLLAMGANFGDLDGDGWLDFYVGTGEPNLSTLVPNVMFRNNEGQSFQDVTTSGGFGSVQKGHGIAFGDIDNDGDEDIYAVMGGAYSGDRYQNILFENPGHGNHWLCLQLEGTTSNRRGVGARVALTLRDAEGGTRTLYRVAGNTSSFGSSSLQLEIGLGQAAAIESLVITWPASGEIGSYYDVPLDAALHIVEGSDTLKIVERPHFTFAPRETPLEGAGGESAGQ